MKQFEKFENMAVQKLSKQRKNGSKVDETWFVYVLRCADSSLYTGVTNDLIRRVRQHNTGTASRYTRSRLPVGLVYHEAHASRSLALKRELAIKALSRQMKELLIRSGGRNQLQVQIQ
jgi:predicted GIY-YIG superfamily endonuclease